MLWQKLLPEELRSEPELDSGESTDRTAQKAVGCLHGATIEQATRYPVRASLNCARSQVAAFSRARVRESLKIKHKTEDTNQPTHANQIKHI